MDNFDYERYQRRCAELVQVIEDAFQNWERPLFVEQELNTPDREPEVNEIHSLLKSRNWRNLFSRIDNPHANELALLLPWTIALLSPQARTYFLPGIFVAVLSAIPGDRLYDSGDLIINTISQILHPLRDLPKNTTLGLDMKMMTSLQNQAIAAVLLHYHELWKDASFSDVPRTQKRLMIAIELLQK